MDLISMDYQNYENMLQVWCVSGSKQRLFIMPGKEKSQTNSRKSF